MSVQKLLLSQMSFKYKIIIKTITTFKTETLNKIIVLNATSEFYSIIIVFSFQE